MINLKEEILREHSKEHALKIATYACSSKKRFKELMDCYLTGDTRLSQRAAWSMSWAARQKPEMIEPYLKELVALLQRTDVHPAIIRNSVRVLQDVTIPEELEADLMNACFQFIEAHTTPVAIKAFSLTILHHLSNTYPEIKSELKLIIEERWEHETAAFRSRAKKILNSK
ncbi:hypothetical protein ACI6Q2_15135 [Chitinophagaceae bacterium LWZ2-11]